MKIPSIEEIKNYFPQYMLAHSNITNRRLHLLGNVLTWMYLFFVLFSMFVNNFWFALGLPLVPLIVYPFAWTGHYIYEKNAPATFSVNPLLTKACDQIMIYKMLTGKIKL